MTDPRVRLEGEDRGERRSPRRRRLEREPTPRNLWCLAALDEALLDQRFRLVGRQLELVPGDVQAARAVVVGERERTLGANAHRHGRGAHGRTPVTTLN